MKMLLVQVAEEVIHLRLSIGRRSAGETQSDWGNELYSPRLAKLVHRRNLQLTRSF